MRQGFCLVLGMEALDLRFLSALVGSELLLSVAEGSIGMGEISSAFLFFGLISRC